MNFFYDDFWEEAKKKELKKHLLLNKWLYIHTVQYQKSLNFFGLSEGKNHDNHSFGIIFYQKFWSSNTVVISQGIPFGDFVVGLQVVQRDGDSA